MSLEIFTFPELQKREEMRYVHWMYVVEFARICRKNNIPIVEVGSGNAKIARWMMDYGHVHPNNMICVDPNPLSYNKDKEVLVSPKYPTIKELLVERQNIIGNCGLLIIRPSPDLVNSCYVLESLEKLSPRIALIIYRADGGDGSTDLHNYFNSIGAPNSNIYDPAPMSKIIKPRENKIRKDYKTISCIYSKEVSDPSLLSVTSALMLTTFKIDSNHLPVGELNSNPPSLKECKTLMLKSQLGAAGQEQLTGENCNFQ
jgi:hypothetical protein